ncbi:MAG: nucleotidyltransferase family protein [Caldilineaceae bacterium]|nr:nucleotidyltransferase family protein [Caldilineaceae bacterium]
MEEKRGASLLFSLWTRLYMFFHGSFITPPPFSMRFSSVMGHNGYVLMVNQTKGDKVKAIVMAGGFGNRLRPLTLSSPKPMLPLIGKPVLAHILDLLKRHQFSDVIITTHYLPEQIQDYFGDGRHMDMTLHYCVEESPLGTAGSVKNVQSYLDDEPFLVISGDIVTDIDLSRVVQFHRESSALATLTLTQVADPTQYGVVLTDQAGRIQQYLEKPSRQQAVSDFVNTGIYVLEPELLDDMKPNTVYDFSYDIFPRMLEQNDALFAYQAEGYWRDMGTMQSYQQSIADVCAGRVDLVRDETVEWMATNEPFVGPPVITHAAFGPLRKRKARISGTLQRKVPAKLPA